MGVETAIDYKNPDSLREGAVLVVGSGQSGCQIAEELNNAGRSTFLSIGHTEDFRDDIAVLIVLNGS